MGHDKRIRKLKMARKRCRPIRMYTSDLLEDVSDVQGLLDAVNKMIRDFRYERGEEPTELRVPDNQWHLLEMAVHECFSTLSKKKRDAIIKRGFDGSGITMFGLKLYGTIRVPHVR